MCENTPFEREVLMLSFLESETLKIIDVFDYRYKRRSYLMRLFRIMSIPITFRLFRVMTSEMLGRLLSEVQCLTFHQNRMV
jgi:hypothetical protein